ncbi:MAG: hypothetical protein ABW211_03450 [Acidimicrobiia bacterium]
MVSIVDRSDRGFVVVTGPDAFSFLQALVSADLDPLVSGDAVASLLLHPQGKLDVTFRLVRVGDEAWLDTDPGLAPQLVASLRKFKIRVKADVDDRSDEYGMLTFIGSDTPPSGDGVIVVPTALGFDAIGPVDAIVELRDASEATVVGGDEWEAFRIEHGIPRQPVDIDEQTIPQEAELEVDAVSFTKGCFLGQELVCRIDSRGHVNRFLRRLVDVTVDGDGARPAVGTEIVVDGKVVGAITSVTPEPYPITALGYVRREVDPGVTVTLGNLDGASSGHSTATVATLRP